MAFHQNSRGRRAQLVFDFSLIEQIQTYTQFEVTLFGSSNAGNVAYFTVVPQGQQPINYNATNNTATFVTSHDLSGTYSYTAYATDILGYTSEIVLKSIKVINSDTDVFYINPNTITRPCISDSSVNNFEITPMGDVKPSTFNPYLSSWSVQFDGTDDFIHTKAASSAFNYGTGAFTIEFWVYPLSGPVSAYNPTFFTNHGDGAWDVTGKGIRIHHQNALIGGTTLTFTQAVQNGRWSHVAIVRNGNTVTAYLNGVANGSLAVLSTTNLGDNTDRIALSTSDAITTVTLKTPNGGREFLNGYISNFRIVKGTAVYTSAFKPPTEPLNAITGTSILICQSNRLIDNSTNAFGITRIGNTQVVPFNPFATQTVNTTTAPAKGSAYFDGNGDYLNFNNPSILSSSATVECWIYMTAAPASGANASLPRAQPIVTAGVGGYSNNSNDHNWLFFIDANSIYFGKSPNFVTVASSMISINQWNHLAVTISGTTSRLYLNGVLVATQASATPLGTTPTYSTSIGVGTFGSGAGSLSYFTGYISNLRITNNAVLYTSNFIPPTEPLTATTNTVLLTCQNSNTHNNHTFVNSATNTSNLVITRNGNVTQGSLSPYSANWSGYFSTGQYISTPPSSEFAFGIEDFTVECWLNPLAQTGVNIIQSSSSNSWGLITFGSQVYWQHNGNNVGTAAGTVPLNAWSHIAITRSSGILRRFLNGVLLNSATDNSNYSGTSSRQIGHTGGSAPFHLSNVRVVKGTAVYIDDFIPPTSTLTAVAGTALLILQNDQFIDNSSNRFALTATGTPTTTLNNISSFSLNTLPTPTSHSVYFDGINTNLSIPNNAAFNFGNGDFTVEFWIYPTNWGSNGCGIVGQKVDDASTGWVIYQNTRYPAKMVTRIGGSGDASDFVSTENVINNVWQHWALVRQSGVCYYYKNGILSNSSTMTRNVTDSTGVLMIGHTQTWTGNVRFTGYISNLRVVKGTAVYTRNFNTATSPLSSVYNTSLLTCQNSTFIDNSTNNFTISSFGRAKPAAINPFGSTSSTANGYSVSKFRGSAYFDGSGDYLSIANNAAFALGTSYTIELWHYRAGTASAGSYTSVMQLVNTQPYGSQLTGFMLTYDGGSVFNFRDSVGSIILSYSSTNLALNTWYHVAIVRNGIGANNMTMYINGVGVVTGNSSGTQATPVPVYIGGDSNGNCSFPGYISDLRITKGTAVYTSNFLPPSAPLTATVNTTLLLDFSAGSIVDSTGNHVIETLGNTRISNKNLKYGAAAMYFNGVSDYCTIPYTTALNIPQSFTIECWVYPIARLTSFPCILNNYSMYGGNGGFAIFAGHNSFNTSTYNVVFNGLQIINSVSGIVYNQWTHIALVRNGSTITLYVNGIANGKSTNQTKPLAGTTDYWWVGAAGDSISSSYFNGNISELRVSKGVRYTSNFTPPNALIYKQ